MQLASVFGISRQAKAYRTSILHLARLLRTFAFMILTRLAVHFNFKCRHEFRGFLWKTSQSNAEIVLVELYRCVTAVHLHRRSLIEKITEHNCFAWPVIDVRIQSVSLPRVTHIVSPTGLTII